MVRPHSPESLPILSRGKHRSPRKGACFMEMASVLAGERWSDHPACTHPLIGQLARLVNDHTSDAGRDRLAVLVPSVIGLTGGGDRWVVGFTGQVAVTAMPGAAESAQRVLAAGLLRARQLTAELGPTAVPRPEDVEAALAAVPRALGWLQRFDVDRTITPRAFASRTAPVVLTAAVGGTAETLGVEADAALRRLLVAGIDAAVALQPVRTGDDGAERPSSAGATRRR